MVEKRKNMRIIAGKFKKTNLFSVPGNTARPTTDYIKEVMFSIIGTCNDYNVLDLFAGSGSLGLEALSRGASFIDFVEFSQKSIQTIKKNIYKIDCIEKCKIYRKKVQPFLKQCDQNYDLILLDPPYNKDIINDVLNLLFEKDLLKQNGLICIEHAINEMILPEYSEKIVNEKKKRKNNVNILTKMREE